MKSKSLLSTRTLESRKPDCKDFVVKVVLMQGRSRLLLVIATDQETCRLNAKRL